MEGIKAMAGWVASGEIKVKLLDTFDQFGISSCSLVIIFFNYNFLLLLFSLVIIICCYHFLLLSRFERQLSTGSTRCPRP